MLLNVKKKSHSWFCNGKPRAHYLVPSKKKGVNFFEWDYNKFTSMNSRWSSYAQIKKKKKQLIQIEIKMVHEWPMIKLIDKTLHCPNLGGTQHFSPYNLFCD